MTDPARIRRERDKAAKLKKSQWWHRLVNRGICHYCEKKFSPSELTMDHVVPLARGGSSTQGNLVPACRECNRDKKLETPVELILKREERSNDE
ncbi:MAG: HNH endonuclease [Oligoflexia bacterium]|nr:HNH endonuclease [Oligoflexia bacterium]